MPETTQQGPRDETSARVCPRPLLLGAPQKGSWEEARTDDSALLCLMHINISWELFKQTPPGGGGAGNMEFIELSFGLGLICFQSSPGKLPLGGVGLGFGPEVT